MDCSRAKELIRNLADGIDPFTGEVLPDDSVCNRPDMIRAFHCALELMDGKEEKKKLPENAGKPWDEEDERVLSDMFDRGCSAKEMQTYFGRTKGAISARLVQLGKIDSRDRLK